MNEVIQFVAAGGSVTAALLIYYVIMIEPRLRSLEKTQLQGQQVDLLKLTRDLANSPALAEKTQQLLEKVRSDLQVIK